MIRLLMFVLLLLSVVVGMSSACRFFDCSCEKASEAPTVETNDATAYITGGTGQDNGYISSRMVVLNGYLLHVGTASFTDPVEVWFEWGTSPSPRIYLHQTQVQSLSQPGAFRHVISPLDPDTTYYFRAAARFDRFYEYGEERSFRPADLMKVIIVSHGMATDAYGDPVVAVEVRNTSTQTVSYAMVTVECKDASGAALQTSVGAASQLVPNQSSKFDVPVPVGTASYDIFVDQVYIP